VEGLGKPRKTSVRTADARSRFEPGTSRMRSPIEDLNIWSLAKEAFVPIHIEQWYSTWGTRTPGGTRRHLGGGDIKSNQQVRTTLVDNG
jgi:hypothetical protein